MSKLQRILLIPRIRWNGACSFFSWLKMLCFGRAVTAQNAQDLARFDNWLGWLAPDMEQHWQSYEKCKPEDKFHYRKNIGSERYRLQAQFAYKFDSFALLSWIILLILNNAVWAAIWWLL